MPPHFKTLESKLYDLGYTDTWQLVKNNTDVLDQPDTPHPTVDYDEQSEFYQTLLDNTKEPLCQNIDVIVPLRDDERLQEERACYRQFLKIIGSPCPEQEPRFINNNSINTIHRSSDMGDRYEFTYIQNDEKRQAAIEELIYTEDAYVDKLRTTVVLFTQKLNPQNHTNRRIIEPYDYKKIFSNIEELLAVNDKFLNDLSRCCCSSTSTTNAASPVGNGELLGFGEVCASHMANFVDCYRTYLLNYFTAQIFHVSVMKNNFDYRRFITDVANDPRCENKTLFDYLIEPPQRIARYTMLLKDILKHTSPAHPDYAPLTRAYAKANEIALLNDDEATKMATMSYSLFNSLKRAPCTMLSQHRTLIAHIDASELHRETSKPKRPVTIVLLSDKLLVAERQNYHSRGIDLSDSGDTSLDGFLSRNLSKDPSLKFHGWVDIEQVQFFKGAPGIPDSFLICASTAQQHGPGPIETADTCDKYFRCGGPRLFQVAIGPQGVQKMNEFIETCQKTQALARRYDQNDEARHRQWSDMNVYANLYDTTSYTYAKYKSNIAVVYVEQEKAVSLKSLFRGAGSMTPWVVALVQGRRREGGRPDGFRFKIMSKVSLTPSRRIIQSTPCATTAPDASSGSWGKHVTGPDGKPAHPLFHHIFWDNIIYCEWHLRHSLNFIQIQDAEMEPYHRTRRRSRSRSLSRSASITTLSNLFSGGGNRSRSTSPSRHQVKPESSRSSPTSGRTTPKEFFSTFTRKSRSRSSSMTSGDKSINSTASSTMATGNDMAQQGRTNGNNKFGQPTLPGSLPDSLLRRPLVASPQEGKLSSDGTAGLCQTSYFPGGGPPPSSFMMYSPPETQYPLRTERDYELGYQPQYSRRMSTRGYYTRSPPTPSTEGEADSSLSRPSSRSSTRSSTPSTVFTHFNNGNSTRAPSPHSNTMSSATSHSAQSSLSFDDSDPAAKPTLKRAGSTQETAADAIQKIKELLIANGGSRPTTTTTAAAAARFPERANGFIVSSIPNEPSRDRNHHPAADKYRSLSGRLLHVRDSLQARASDTHPEQSYILCNRLNTDLENIAAMVESIHLERRPTAGMMDAEAEIARKVQQAQADREQLDRFINDFKTKAVKMGHRQSM